MKKEMIIDLQMFTNEFLEMKQIARELLPILKENLVFPLLVNKNYSGAYSAARGDTILVEKPAVFIADEFSGTINLQDIGEKKVPVKLDKLADVSIAVSAADFALSSQDFRTKYLESAATSLAEKINTDGLELYKDVPSYVGVAGVTPDALSDIAAARRVLNVNKVPTSPRNAVWDPYADEKLATLDALTSINKSGSPMALREGEIGRVHGINSYMSQAVKTHVAGGYTALADVTAAVTFANNTTDSASGFVYSTVVLTSTAEESVAKVLKGDLINMTDDNGKVYQVAVLEDSAEAIAGVVTVKVINELLADVTDVAVTFVDVTAGGHVANLAFHPLAFAFVTRPLDQPRSQNSYVVNYDGLSLRVVEAYNVTTKVTTLSMDILYSYKTIYPQLATRILG